MLKTVSVFALGLFVAACGAESSVPKTAGQLISEKSAALHAQVAELRAAMEHPGDWRIELSSYDYADLVKDGPQAIRFPMLESKSGTIERSFPSRDRPDSYDYTIGFKNADGALDVVAVAATGACDPTKKELCSFFSNDDLRKLHRELDVFANAWLASKS